MSYDVYNMCVQMELFGENYVIGCNAQLLRKQFSVYSRLRFFYNFYYILTLLLTTNSD